MREEGGASWASFAWLVLVIFALLVAGLFLGQPQAERGSLEAEYSTYRTDARGAKALYLTLGQLGHRVVRWQRDFAGLPSPGVLFVLAPPRTGRAAQRGDILPYELRDLDGWVERGNTVVVMSADPNALYEALGVYPAAPARPASSEPAQPGPLTAGVKEAGLPAGRIFRFGRDPRPRRPWEPEPEDLPSPIPAIGAERWLPLFGTGAQPVAMLAARGRGQYVVVADAHAASNLGLATPANLRLMVNLASLAGPRGSVLFDEAHHRELGRGFVAYARARNMVPVLFYLLVLVGLGIWRSGVRFGPPLPPVNAAARDSGEYVRAVAALYQSAEMGRDSLAANDAQFRRRAAAALRLRRWQPEEAAARLAARTGRPATEVRQTFEEVAAALARPNLPGEEAFALVRRLADLERDLR